MGTHFVEVKSIYQWVYLINKIKGNLTYQQNLTDQSECTSDEIDPFNGFTVEEKCFDKHEDSMYLQQCNYYIEVGNGFILKELRPL